jgi:hypothetical protein
MTIDDAINKAISEWTPERIAEMTRLSNRLSKRQWIGLTDEDKAMCVQATVERGSVDELIAAIEAKLKEKNA